MFKNLRSSLLALAVVAGSSVVAEVTFAAESDGTIDSGFGSSGIKTIEGVQYSNPLELSSGKVVMFAVIENDANSSGPDRLDIIRINSDGTTDTTFGAAGVLQINVSGFYYYQYESAVADASGGFLLAFYANAASTYQSRLTQITSAGVVNSLFGTNGFVDVPKEQASGTVRSINIDASTGNIYTFSDGSQTEIARFTSTGALDSSFNPSGQNTALQTWPASGACGQMWRVTVRGVWVDPSETFAYVYGTKGGPSGTRVLGLAKYQFSTRTCDTTFGGDLFNSSGSRTSDSTPDGFFEYNPAPTTSDLKAKIYIQSDGSAYGLFKGDSVTSVAKFTTSGALDNTYGTSGVTTDLTSSFAGSFSLTADLAIASDGSMRVVGQPTTNGRYATLVKLDASGAVDTSFGTGGVVTTPSCQSLNYTTSIRTSNGSILAVSSSSTGMWPNMVYSTHLVKIGSGGSSSQCGTTTTTTTTTQPPTNNPGGGGGGGGSSPPPPSPNCTAGAGSTSASNVTLDNNFGTNGVWSLAESGYMVDFMDGLVGADGKAYFLVNVQGSGSGSLNNTSRIYRVNVDGSVDTTWGTNGYAEIDVVNGNQQGVEYHRRMAQLSDGSFMLAGHLQTWTGGMGSSPTEEVYALRVTSAGAVDTSWGNSGRVAVLGPRTASGSGVPGELVLGDSGSVLVSSSEYDYSTQTSTFKVYKVTAAGVKDTSFAGTGELVTTGMELVSDSTGAFYVSGSTSTTPRNASLWKYDANGSAVSSFGTNGQLVIDRGSGNEYLGSLTVANGKVYGIHRETGSGPSGVKTAVGRFDPSGSVDTSFATSGFRTVFETGWFMPVDLTVLADGSLLMVGIVPGSAGVVLVDASGSIPSSMSPNGATFSSGTCDADYMRALVFGGSFYAYGSTYTGVAGLAMAFKFTISGTDASVPGSSGGGSSGGGSSGGGSSGGGSPGGGSSGGGTPAPTLVTSENQALLESEPGTQGMIVNGQSVQVETTRVELSAARTPASQRTPSQVAAIQAAGQALLQEFLDSLPPGSSTNVTVVNTTTGAVMQNLVFDANGNSVDVPVEDILILDGPSISIMLGSDNATISSDGKYVVGVGGTVGVVGAGFDSNASGELVVMSTPTLVDTFTASAAGDVAASASLPDSVGVGDHTLVAATNGVYAVIGIRVVPTSLPATGVDEGTSTLIVLGLFVGVMAAVVTRSRRLLVIR